ncbi:MAG TPA: AAA family ATPase, partial [Caldilineaceae bacterium]|nr:AAA family ATPase [Caldilineaceae bacterium]
SAANCDASFIIPARELLTLSFEQLVQRVVHGHQRLFPLVLAALEERPMPLIGNYLEPLLDDTDEDEEETGPAPVVAPAPYTQSMFLQETSLESQQMTDLFALLQDKPQLILQGPPGTSKTYVAQRLAKLLTGLAEPGQQVVTVQFHPAYGYEDFIEGIRPESKPGANGHHVVDYPVLPGRFQTFCTEAARHVETDTPFVFIIDEINRGNIPRIFGELMYLLEYRQESVLLPYSGKPFQIPPNVYLIGTMNTADRSIALVDFALRRRFHFVTMKADPDLFDRWFAAQSLDLAYLPSLYRRLCEEAIDDPHYHIGPSYFMDEDLTEEKLARIWRYNIEPLLLEYYVENHHKAEQWFWENELVQTIRNGHTTIP